MKRVNLLLTLSSLNVLLVTIERFSFTTRVVLQPYNFIRLHEIVQITFLILATVLIPAFLFKVLSHDFASMKTGRVQLTALLFVIGVYFYATGNGLHEVASFLLNEYCKNMQTLGAACQSIYINNFYTGNIYYFIGAMMMNFSLILLEMYQPVKEGNRRDYIILTINSLVYAAAIVAYAAIDPVIVGLVFSTITMIGVDLILIFTKRKFWQHPFAFYCGLAYTIGTILSYIVRFR